MKPNNAINPDVKKRRTFIASLLAVFYCGQSARTRKLRGKYCAHARTIIDGPLCQKLCFCLLHALQSMLSKAFGLESGERAGRDRSSAHDRDRRRTSSRASAGGRHQIFARSSKNCRSIHQLGRRSDGPCVGSACILSFAERTARKPSFGGSS